MTSTKNHLNRTSIVDKNGKKTTVYRRPEGKAWATGSMPAAPASRAAVVSSAPTPPKPFTALAGLAHNDLNDTTIPEGADAQWREFFRRAAEGGQFPLDVYEEDGATVTHEWSLNRDGDGGIIHVKRELSTRWDSSAAMERLWESGMSYRGVGEDSFDSFVERSVEGINRNLLQYEFDASRVQHYDEPMLETDDVMEIMRDVGLDPDDPRVVMDADDIWGRIGFKYSVSAEGIDRDDFIAYLSEKNLLNGGDSE